MNKKSNQRGKPPANKKNNASGKPKKQLTNSKPRPKTTDQARSASRGEAIRAQKRSNEDATRSGSFSAPVRSIRMEPNSAGVQRRM